MTKLQAVFAGAPLQVVSPQLASHCVVRVPSVLFGLCALTGGNATTGRFERGRPASLPGRVLMEGLPSFAWPTATRESGIENPPSRHLAWEARRAASSFGSTMRARGVEDPGWVRDAG